MMNSDKYLRWFIIFLIINLIVSLLYLLLGMIFNRTSRKKVLTGCFFLMEPAEKRLRCEA